MISKRDAYKKSVVNAIKNGKYFSASVEGGLMVASNEGDYMVLMDNDGKELYMFRLLEKREYKKLRRHLLPNGWVLETNGTEYALVYKKKYDKRPIVAKFQTDIVEAIDTIKKGGKKQ
ncbi:MAG: hypothetical protein IKT38_01830 [Clostridia bacterium]|nr:hypothetical protein [Clostridia bacterium]